VIYIKDLNKLNIKNSNKIEYGWNSINNDETCDVFIENMFNKFKSAKSFNLRLVLRLMRNGKPVHRTLYKDTVILDNWESDKELFNYISTKFKEKYVKYDISAPHIVRFIAYNIVEC